MSSKAQNWPDGHPGLGLEGSQIWPQVPLSLSEQIVPAAQMWIVSVVDASPLQQVVALPPSSHSPTVLPPTVKGTQVPSLVPVTLHVELRAPLPVPGPQVLN